MRERYESITPAQAVADMAASDAKFFTIIDALKGYHQCPLDLQSQPLQHSLHPSEGLSTSVPRMASHQYLNTTIDA